MRRGIGRLWFACVFVAACGDDEGLGDGADGTGRTEDGGATADTGTGTGDGSGDATSVASGGGSGGSADDADDGTGPFTGECDGNVALALADGVGLQAMTVEAIRRQVEGSDVPTYIVQVHGSAATPNRLDIVFGGLPVAGTIYDASGEPGGVQNTPLVGLYPSNEQDNDFVSGTVQYLDVADADGEILVLEVDLTFTGGTLTGCIADPIEVEFVAPP